METMSFFFQNAGARIIPAKRRVTGVVRWWAREFGRIDGGIIRGAPEEGLRRAQR
jgi:hypothetical protein